MNKDDLTLDRKDHHIPYNHTKLPLADKTPFSMVKDVVKGKIAG